MRNWIRLVESAPDIDEALWWVIRYVSGSLTDPDWDWGHPNQLDINSAMEMVGRYIGNKKSVGRPLYRYLLVDQKTALDLSKTKMLKPFGKMAFQSFTSADINSAIEIGRDINPYISPKLKEVVVTIMPPPNDVLFGYADVKGSRKPGVGDLRAQWQDWAHQDEVFVQIKQPIPCGVKILNKKSQVEEKYETGFSGIRGAEVVIYRNPTRREWKSISEDDSVRALVDGDDLIVWNTYTALHQMVRDHLNLRDAISIVIYGSLGQDIGILITDNNRNTQWMHNPDTAETIRDCAYIANNFSDVEISYFDEAIVGPWDDLSPDPID